MEANSKGSLESITTQSYDDFSESMDKSKNLIVTELFGKQLIQFPHCNSEKAAAIVKLYPTARSLREALYATRGKYCTFLFLRISVKEREDFLKNVEFGQKKRKLGSSLSKTICSFYADVDTDV